MSAAFKFLSPLSLTVLLFAVTMSGRAQDDGAKPAASGGDLPVVKESVREEPGKSGDDGTEADSTDTDRGSVPSASEAVEPESFSPGSASLPVVPPVSRYEKIWRNSPFELEAAPDVVSTARESFARDYALSAMLKDGDETTVWIINRKTRETIKVTEEGGEGGFSLKSLQGDSNNVRDVEATVVKDGEEARLTYDKVLMAGSAGAALKNHPSAQRNRDDAQNPRQGAAVTNPQDRGSAAAAAARARSTEVASRAGGADRMAAPAPQAGRSGTAPKTPVGRRRIVLPKAPVPQEPK